MEQVRGVEPPYSAWEADVLPMNYICITVSVSYYSINRAEKQPKPFCIKIIKRILRIRADDLKKQLYGLFH